MATDLLSQADELLELANHIQDDAVSEQERRAKLDELSKKYHRWYTQAINAFAQDEARKLFEEEYVGSLLSSKISMFLKQGHKIYRFYNPEKPNALMPKWSFPVERTFVDPLRQQVILLEAARLPPSPHLQAKGQDERWFMLFERLTVIESKLDQLLAKQKPPR